MNVENKNSLTEYADWLLKLALYKAGNIYDAEDLVQETLLAALAYTESGKAIKDAKNWLSSVLNRKFYDNLRRKYRKPTVSLGIAAELALSEEAELCERAEKSEEAETVRRCVSMLTKNYREVIVRHYMNGESLKQIAESLNIPLNTVKSRLYTGREHIGKEFDMENYTKQSYQPETLWIGSTGEPGINDEPCSLVGGDKIKMNLLILAYEKPVTVTELAGAIGIPTAYVEPIVDGLIKGELMGRVGDKVYTDFIISGENDKLENLDAQLKIAEENYAEIWKLVEEGLAELREQDYYTSQRESARLKLESHFVTRVVQQAVDSVRNIACGGLEPFSEYPVRPDGGKWYAIGNRYANNYDSAKSRFLPYGINGEWSDCVFGFLDTKYLSLTDYDTELCHVNSLYNGSTHDKSEALKMLYSVYTDNKDAFSAADRRCIDKIDKFIETGFLSKNAEGKLVCEIPIISGEERKRYYSLVEKHYSRISDKFRGVFMTLMDKPLKIPAHVKSYPKWLRYCWCAEYLPMAVILKAKEKELFKKPAAAVYMTYEK